MEEKVPTSAEASQVIYYLTKATKHCTKRCEALRRDATDLSDDQRECLQICGNNAANARWEASRFFGDFANRYSV